MKEAGVAGKNSHPVIKDVAACAGVSVSTVSRFLNNSPRLSEESKEKIARAIELLGYRPSSIARGLVNSRIKTIAILSTNTTLLGSALAIEGIEDEARSQDYSVMITRLDGDTPEDLKRSVDLVLDLNPSGIVLLKYDDKAEIARRLIPENVPLVVIGGTPETMIDQVSLNEYEGGREITEYLLGLGHPTVHHLRIPIRSEGNSRTDGWEAALKARGVPVPQMLETTWRPQDARAIGEKLAADKSVSAIFAGNDEIAMGVIRGLTDHGVRVPEDVSVVGFDDHMLAQIWKPGITTMRQNFAQAGREAVKALLRRLCEPDAPSHTISVPGTLVYRESAARYRPR
nr:LacI family DNA-binding transcriptional regulator [Arcanobacterium phocae]